MRPRFHRRKREREHEFGDLYPPIIPVELPPAMWLPPLRAPAPKGVPAGMGLGALKPQRGPDTPRRANASVVDEWEPWRSPTPGRQKRRHGWLVAGIGAAGGLLVLLAALDIGHTAAVGEPELALSATTRGTEKSGIGVPEFPASAPRPQLTSSVREELGVNPEALSAAMPDTEPQSRWRLPLERWSSVTDRYGAPRGNGVLHGGIDLALDGMHRSPVHPACEGAVQSTGYSGVYGYHVIVDCGDGWSTLYGHLSEIDVARGQGVVFEDVLGLSGSSGQAEGEHLHFEIRWRGAAVNPERYLDFHIPAWAPLTHDRRDANGNLVTPEPPTPGASPTATATSTVTPTATPTNTPTPQPTRTAAQIATAEAIGNAVRR